MKIFSFEGYPRCYPSMSGRYGPAAKRSGTIKSQDRQSALAILHKDGIFKVKLEEIK